MTSVFKINIYVSLKYLQLIYKKEDTAKKTLSFDTKFINIHYIKLKLMALIFLND